MTTPDQTSASAGEALSGLEEAALGIEREWMHRIDRGQKGAVIAERTGLSPIGYYQVLNRLLEDQRAIAAEPVVLGRLRRLRDSRQRRRRPSVHV